MSFRQLSRANLIHENNILKQRLEREQESNDRKDDIIEKMYDQNIKRRKEDMTEYNKRKSNSIIYTLAKGTVGGCLLGCAIVVAPIPTAVISSFLILVSAISN